MSYARTFPLRVRARESKEAGPVFGLNTGELLARYDPDTRSLKTSQHLLFEDSTEYLVRLPRSGTMRSGRIYAQKTWVLRTEGKESGLFPTQTGQEIEHSEVELTETGRRLTKDGKDSHSLNLADTVKKWPTPDSSPRGTRAMDLTEETLTVKRRGSGQRRGMDLQTAAKKWPTPHANASTGSGMQGRQGGKNIQTAVAETIDEYYERTGEMMGALNPNWVDVLMGYMPGWTDGKMEYHVSLLVSKSE